MNYSVYLISNKPESYPILQQSLESENIEYFDGSGYPSFSNLVNTCVASSPAEIVIMASDKVRPKACHVKQTLSLLDQGHGFVGLYSFAFFGIRKELFRKIGMFDERYIGGGFEDYDFIVRLIESNISMFITFDVPYILGPSGWGDYSKAYPHWCSKWQQTWKDGHRAPYRMKRMMAEESYNYDLGPSVHSSFLSCKENSYVEYSPHVSPFFFMEIT